jgi:hypothetical protein
LYFQNSKSGVLLLGFEKLGLTIVGRQSKTIIVASIFYGLQGKNAEVLSFSQTSAVTPSGSLHIFLMAGLFARSHEPTKDAEKLTNINFNNNK